MAAENMATKETRNESIETKLVWKTYDTEGRIVEALVQRTVVRDAASQKVLYITEASAPYVTPTASIVIYAGVLVPQKEEKTIEQRYVRPTEF